MTGRDQPRRLAPVLFAGFNIVTGVVLFLTRHAQNRSLAHVDGPIGMWAVLFVVLGCLIPLGILDWRIAVVTSTLSVLFWAGWAWMIAGAVQHQAHLPADQRVSWRAVSGPLLIGYLHLLLAPYNRVHGDRRE